MDYSGGGILRWAGSGWRRLTTVRPACGRKYAHGSLWAPDPDCLLEEEELVASPEDALRSDARA